MPLENLNALHYTAAEKSTVTSYVSSLESVLSPKFKNLSPEERTKYGSVNEQNKLLINKVKDFRTRQPAMSTPDIDWAEFQNDYDSREFLQGTIMQLEGLVQSLKSIKILHDYDNYQVALTDYDFSKYKSNTKTPGFEIKVNELSQFFPRTSTTTKKPEEPTL